MGHRSATGSRATGSMRLPEYRELPRSPPQPPIPWRRGATISGGTMAGQGPETCSGRGRVSRRDLWYCPPCRGHLQGGPKGRDLCHYAGRPRQLCRSRLTRLSRNQVGAASRAAPPIRLGSPDLQDARTARASGKVGPAREASAGPPTPLRFGGPAAAKAAWSHPTICTNAFAAAPKRKRGAPPHPPRVCRASVRLGRERYNMQGAILARTLAEGLSCTQRRSAWRRPSWV